MAKLNLNLISSYAPSPWVNWEAASLKLTPWMDHEDPIVQAEFNRFVRRDLAVLVTGAMFCGGSVLYQPLGFFDNGNLFFMNIIASITSGICFIGDALLHLTQENTARVSQVRTVLQVLLPMTFTLTTSTSTELGYSTLCEGTQDLYKLIGLPRPDVTTQRVELFCKSVINAFPIVTMSSVLVAFVIPVKVLWLPYVFMFLLLAISRPLGAFPEETGIELFIRIVIFFAICFTSAVLLWQRFVLVVKQFHQAIDVVKSSRKAEREAEEVDLLLCAMVPVSALMRLSAGETVLDHTTEATVLFSDMVQFTAWSSKRTAQQVVSMLNTLCVEFDFHAELRGVEKVKTIGDAYWAVTGLPDSCDDHASRMVEFGNGMLDIVEEQNKRHPEWNRVQIRIGIHSGDLWGGILGKQQLSYEVFGMTSAIAEEVEKGGVASRGGRTALFC